MVRKGSLRSLEHCRKIPHQNPEIKHQATLKKKKERKKERLNEDRVFNSINNDS